MSKSVWAEESERANNISVGISGFGSLSVMTS